MKFSLVSLLPVLGLFTTAFADPVAQPPAVVKRQDYSVESSILADLLNNVKSQTGAISTSFLRAIFSPIPRSPEHIC